MTGTAEEIDAQLPKILMEFTESHVNLQQTFDQAKEKIAAAVKAIDEREKNKPKTKSAAKQDNKQETKTEQKQGDDKKSDSGELLPLWCKPPQGGTKEDGASTATTPEVDS